MQFVVISLSFVLLAGACGGGTQNRDASASGDATAADLAAEVMPEAATGPDSSTMEAGSGDSGGGDAPPGDAAFDATPEAPQQPFTPIDPCPAPSAYTLGGGAIVTGNNVYVPACLRIPAGSSVTIGASTFHPLEPGAGGSPGNPIPTQVVDATVAFPTPGFYPFYCPEHIGEGMRGVVWVTGL